MSPEPYRVALIGMGTVGTGVARLLIEHADRMQRRAGRPIEVRRVVVRDIQRSRQFPVSADLITDDLQTVLDDPQIDLAVQLIGGLSPAREIMLALLKSGKDVVTANKALLCEHGDEIFACAHEQGRSVAFEAAVAGGIPIITALAQSMAANQIVSIEAILNGTSNYILTEMLSSGQSYDAALKAAQDLGYAEADPTMDVDGTDAAQKLCLLVQLAYGLRVTPRQFLCQGIDSLSLVDLQYADELGYRIKLLAVARLVEGALEIHVQPTLTRKDRPLANVNSAFNAVLLEGDAVGKTWFTGSGAGQMPTASAVTADIIDMAVGRAQLTFRQSDLGRRGDDSQVQLATDAERRFYLRFTVEDRPRVLAEIADCLGRHGISIASVMQHEAPEVDDDDSDGERARVPLVIMTHRTREAKLTAAHAELESLKANSPPYIRVPVAD